MRLVLWWASLFTFSFVRPWTFLFTTLSTQSQMIWIKSFSQFLRIAFLIFGLQWLSTLSKSWLSEFDLMVGLTIVHPIYTVSYISISLWFQNKLMNAKGLLALIVSEDCSIHEKCEQNQSNRYQKSVSIQCKPLQLCTTLVKASRIPHKIFSFGHC